MREEVAAAVAGVWSSILAANELHNVELCRGAMMALRGTAISLRVWPEVLELVDTGDAMLLLDQPHRPGDGNL